MQNWNFLQKKVARFLFLLKNEAEYKNPLVQTNWIFDKLCSDFSGSYYVVLD